MPWLSAESPFGAVIFKGPLVAQGPQLSWVGHLSHGSPGLLIFVPIWEQAGKILLLEYKHKNRELLRFLSLLPQSMGTGSWYFPSYVKIHLDLTRVHTYSVCRTQYIGWPVFVCPFNVIHI